MSKQPPVELSTLLTFGFKIEISGTLQHINRDVTLNSPYP